MAKHIVEIISLLYSPIILVSSKLNRVLKFWREVIEYKRGIEIEIWRFTVFRYASPRRLDGSCIPWTWMDRWMYISISTCVSGLI